MTANMTFSKCQLGGNETMGKKILVITLILSMLLCLTACTRAEKIEGAYVVEKIKFCGTTYTPEDWEEYFGHGPYLTTAKIIIDSNGTALTADGKTVLWDKTGNKITFYTATIVFNDKTLKHEIQQEIVDEAKLFNGKLVFGPSNSKITTVNICHEYENSVCIHCGKPEPKPDNKK